MVDDGEYAQHESDAEEQRSEQPNAKAHFVESMVGYRNLRRRFDQANAHGVDLSFFRPRDGVSGSVISWNGSEFINYTGYNYLGLAGDPRVSQAAKDAIDRFGTSASASRIVSGEIELHREFESRMADFLGVDDCVTFVSGYLTNVTVISHLLTKVDAVIYDSGAHNSIFTGARLSGAEQITFPIGDWDALDRLLSSRRNEFRRGLLVCEGVYSMDGQILDLARAVEIKERYGLILMVDEAHSFGTLGDTGRGICEFAGLPPRVIDIHMGTLSKTLAGAGGYVAGDRRLIEYIRYLAPGFIFSVGLSPPDTAAALEALKILEAEPNRSKELRDRIHAFRRLGRECDLTVGGDEDAPVASVIVGDDIACFTLSQRLLEHGVHVQPIVYPAVAARTARLRFFITHNHTDAQFRATIPTLARELNDLEQKAQ